MGIKSRGRGTAAAFGLLLLFAGLIGGGVLYVLSVRRPTQAVDAFARAPVGCTTTLDFTESGTFFVYEESDAVPESIDGGCQPAADPLQSFGFELTGPAGPIVPRRDDSVEYDTSDHTGRSIARIEIDRLGEYEIAVFGDDVATLAAIGRDPDDGVGELRRGALIVAVAGVVLGLLLLVLAGRRSRKAATYAAPDGPGWGPRPTGAPGSWPPEPPRVGQVPINPHQPAEPAHVATPTTTARPGTPAGTGSIWAPPTAADAPSDGRPPPPPPSSTPPPAEEIAEPTLPDRPGRPSGESPSIVDGGDRRV
jgi:hypothetical protein